MGFGCVQLTRWSEMTMDLDLSPEEQDIAVRALRCYESHLSRIGAEGNDGSEEFLIDALEYYASFLGEQFGPNGLELHDDVETPEIGQTMAEIDRCSALSIRLELECFSQTSYWDH
jgi:hypothetical protein